MRERERAHACISLYIYIYIEQTFSDKNFSLIIGVLSFPDYILVILKIPNVLTTDVTWLKQVISNYHMALFTIL